MSKITGVPNSAADAYDTNGDTGDVYDLGVGDHGHVEAVNSQDLTVVWDAADGDEDFRVTGSPLTSTLRITGLKPSQVEFWSAGADMYVANVATGKTFLIEGQQTGGTTGIEDFVFDDGTTIHFSAVNAIARPAIYAASANVTTSDGNALVYGTTAATQSVTFGDASDGGSSNEFVYASADGSATLHESVSGSSNITVRLVDLEPSDVVLNAFGPNGDLLITVSSTGRTISVPGTFSSTPNNGASSIVFADGTTLSGRAAIQAAFTPTVIAPTAGSGAFTSADKPYGSDEIVDAPGVGSITVGDRQDGGNVTTVDYHAADGGLILQDHASSAIHVTLNLVDLRPSDVAIGQNGNDLSIFVKSTGAIILVPATFANGDGPYDGIEAIRFADGTTLANRAAIQAAMSPAPAGSQGHAVSTTPYAGTPTASGPTYVPTAGSDTSSGSVVANDHLNYFNGGGTVAFQAGVDSNVSVDFNNYGGKSAPDLFKYAAADGDVWIRDTSAASDVLQFTDLKSGDVTFSSADSTYGPNSTAGKGNDLVITVTSTGRTLTLDNFNSFGNAGPQTFVFADGVSMSRGQVLQSEPVAPPSSAKIRFDGAYSYKDLTDGGSPDAADVYFDGKGDTVETHGGADTFHYVKADGDVKILDYQAQTDVLRLDDLNLADVTFRTAPGANASGQGSSDLQLVVNSSGAVIDVWNQLTTSGATGVGSIVFADGTVVAASQFAGLAAANPAGSPLGTPGAHVGAGSTATLGGALTPGQHVQTSSGYELVYQNDGNVVIYDVSGTAVWTSATGNGSPGRLVMQGDGNLVAYDTSGNAYWSSGTAGDAGAVATLGEDGVLRIASADGTQTYWHGGAAAAAPVSITVGVRPGPAPAEITTLAAGQSVASASGYVLTLQGDGEVVVKDASGHVTWTSGSVHASPAVLEIQADGNLVAYDATGTAYWASNTSGNPGATAVLGEDGVLRVESANGNQTFWNSNGSSADPYQTPGATGSDAPTMTGSYNWPAPAPGHYVVSFQPGVDSNIDLDHDHQGGADVIKYASVDGNVGIRDHSDGGRDTLEFTDVRSTDVTWSTAYPIYDSGDGQGDSLVITDKATGRTITIDLWDRDGTGPVNFLFADGVSFNAAQVRSFVDRSQPSPAQYRFDGTDPALTVGTQNGTPPAADVWFDHQPLDTVTVGGGRVTYHYASADGGAKIVDTQSQTDVLSLSDLKQSDVVIRSAAGANENAQPSSDLQIVVKATGKVIDVFGQLNASNPVGIGSVVFSDGTTLNAAQLAAAAAATAPGTPQGTAGVALVAGQGPTIYAYAGSDAPQMPAPGNGDGNFSGSFQLDAGQPSAIDGSAKIVLFRDGVDSAVETDPTDYGARSTQIVYKYASTNGDVWMRDSSGVRDVFEFTDLKSTDVVIGQSYSTGEDPGSVRNLTITVKATGKVLTFDDYVSPSQQFSTNSNVGPRQFIFADGESYDYAQMTSLAKAAAPSAAQIHFGAFTTTHVDTNYGSPPTADVYFDAQNDTVFSAGTKATYHYAKADGYAAVFDNGGQTSTLALSDLDASDVTFANAASPYFGGITDVQMTVTATGKVVVLAGEYNGQGVAQITFMDGTTMSAAAIQAAASAGGTTNPLAIQQSGQYTGNYTLTGTNVDIVSTTDATSSQGAQNLVSPTWDVYAGIGGGQSNIYPYGQGDLTNGTIRIHGLRASDFVISIHQGTDSDIVLTDLATGDTVNLGHGGDTSFQGFQNVVFDDGTTWSRAYLLANVSDVVENGNSPSYSTNGAPTIYVGQGGGDLTLHDGGGATILYSKASGIASPGGDGTLTINDASSTGDTLRMKDLDASDVTITQSVLDMVITVKATGAKIVLPDQDGAHGGAVDTIAWADGTTTDITHPGVGTVTTFDDTANSGPVVYDLGAADFAKTTEGSVALYHDDPLTIVWKNGYGNQIFSVQQNNPGNAKVVTDMAPSQVLVQRAGDDLKITNLATGKVLTIVQGAWTSQLAVGVSEIDFGDGSVMTRDQIDALKSTYATANAGDSSNDPNVTYHLGTLDPGRTINIDHDDNVVVEWAAGDSSQTFQIEGNNYTNSATLKLIGLKTTDVSIDTSGNNLLVRDLATGNVLTINDENAYGWRGVKQIVFDDGTVLAHAAIQTAHPTITLAGYDQTVTTADGSWNVVAGAGNDVVVLGDRDNAQTTGTVSYAAADGNLTVTSDTYGPTSNVLQLTDLGQSDVTISRQGADLFVVVTSTGRTIDVTGQFSGGSQGFDGISQIVFKDGSTMTAAQIAALANQGLDTSNTPNFVYDLGTGNHAPVSAYHDDALTVVWAKADGNERFASEGNNYQASMTLQLADMNASDVTVERPYGTNDIVVVNDATGATFTASGEYNSNQAGLAAIVFADGTSLTRAQINASPIYLPENATVSIGNNDVVAYLPKDGAVTVNASIAYYDGQENSQLVMTGLASTDVSMNRVGDDLQITVLSTGKVVTLPGEFARPYGSTSGLYNGVASVAFSDATLSQQTLAKTVLTHFGDAANVTLGATDSQFSGSGYVFGAGTDLLQAYNNGGSATFHYLQADGNATIDVGDQWSYNAYANTLAFDDLKSTDVTLSRSGDDMIVTVNATGRTVVVKNELDAVRNGQPDHAGVQHVTFADGVSLDDDAIFNSTPIRLGDAPNVTVSDPNHDYAQYGGYLPVFIAGKGDGVINADESGSPTVIYSKLDGNLAYNQHDNWYDQTTSSTLKLVDLDASDLVFSRSGEDMMITVKSTGKVITVGGEFNNQYNSAQHDGFAAITFADGTSYAYADMVAQSWFYAPGGAAALNTPDDASVYRGIQYAPVIVIGPTATLVQSAENGWDDVKYSTASGNLVYDKHDAWYDSVFNNTLDLTDLRFGDVTIAKAANGVDVTVTVTATGRTIFVPGEFNQTYDGRPHDGFQNIKFADGIVMNMSDIVAWANGTYAGPAAPTSIAFSGTIDLTKVQTGDVVGTAVGHHAAANQDFGETYVLANDDGGAFSIDPSTGIVTVKSAAALKAVASGTDHQNPVVTVTDVHGLSYTGPITVGITAPGAGPTISASLGIAKPTATVGEYAGRATAVDGTGTPEQASNYEIVGSTLAGAFAIDPGTGIVSVADANAVIHDKNSAETITVTAVDASGRVGTGTLSIDLSAPATPLTALAFGSSGVSSGPTAVAGLGAGRFVATEGSMIGNGFTYSLIYDGNGRYVIDAATGRLSIAPGATISYGQADVVVAQAIDASGNVYRQVGAVPVNAGYEAPSPISVTQISAVAENAAAGTKVATVLSTTPTQALNGDTVTYSLSAASAKIFAVDPNSGVVTVRTAGLLSFLAAPEQQVTVIAKDRGGGYTTQATFTVQVTDVDHAPTGGVVKPAGTYATPTVVEHAAAGTVVATLTGIDPDVTNASLPGAIADHLSYSLSANPGGAFAVDPTTGIVTVANPAAVSYGSGAPIALKATVTDAYGKTSLQTIAIPVTVIPNAPPTAKAVTASTREDVKVSVALAGTVGDQGDALTYRIVGAPPAGTATITGSTLSFTPDASYHHLAPGAVQNVAITYVAVDQKGLSSAPATATIAVTGTDDAPTAGADVVATSRNTPVTVSAAALLANDASVEDGAKLSITAVSGAVGGTLTTTKDAYGHVASVTYAPSATFLGAGSFTYTLSDGYTGTATGKVTVSVTQPADRAPTAVAGTPGAQVVANAGAGTLLTTLQGVDPDVAAYGDRLSYSISGPQASLLAVNAATGAVTLKAGASLAGLYGQVLTFTATATDSSNLSFSAPVSVAVVKPADVAPTALRLTAPGSATTLTGVKELLAVGTVVGQLSASDPDVASYGDHLTYALSNSDGGMFAVDPVTGTVTIAKAGLTFLSSATTAPFAAVVTDSAGKSTTLSATLKVLPNAPPYYAATHVNAIGAATDQNHAVTTYINAKAGDPGDTLSYRLISTPANGTVSFGSSAGAATAVWTPDAVTRSLAAGVHETVAFSYETFDQKGLGSAPQTVTIDVVGIADKPVATPDSFTTTSAQPLVLHLPDVIGNDLYDQGDAIGFNAVGSAVGGTVSLSADKSTVTFTPTGIATTAGGGAYSFSYQLYDATQKVASASATETVVVVANVITVPVDASAVTGTAGIDKFVVSGGTHAITTAGGQDVVAMTGRSFGVVTVTDFHGSATAAATDLNHEFLQFDSQTFTSFAAVQAHMTDDGHDTTIAWDAADRIVLKNIVSGALHSNDFHFVT